MISALWRVLRWLDESNWKWVLPKGATRIDRTPIRLDVDRQKSRTRRVSSGTYSPHELAIIASKLDKFGKLILGLSVNCAMQPAEVGRLEILDFSDRHPETQEVGNWITFDRPKTNEYGEWILWPEVAELVQWGIVRATATNASRLIVAENGTPWYREDWTKPEARFANWWQGESGIVTRLSREHQDFPRHTLKMLRKVLPNLIRPGFGQEVADLVNARKVDDNGRVGGKETDRYADRLYHKVAEAIRSLEPVFNEFRQALKS